MSYKTKAEQKKEFKEYIAVADKRVLDTKKSGVELIANDEVFVIVNGTNNYWISNYGRLTNNLRGNFYMHKKGYAHYTISGSAYKIETYTDKLVAEHFLENPKKYKRIWHIDRDKNNCFYRNLVWVNDEEYIDLERGILRVEELGRQQEYVPYITLKSNTAYSIWNGIYNRCYKGDEAYKGSFMCDLWLNDKDSFAEWWSAEYYECDGESMAVDKDLLFPGNKEYAPDKCCIIPQTLNTMLSNCKKHRLPKWKSAIPVVVDGLIAAKDDQGWSLVKEDGEVLLSGMSQIGVDDNELSTMLSDYMGGDNISFTRDYIQAIKQGRIRVCNSAGQWGIVDKEGKYVINPQFDDIIADGDGYLFEKGNQWGWCDAEGKYVINPQFRDALTFDGHALAGARDSGGKWGLIDRDGKWTVNPQFGKIGKFLPNGNIIAQDASSKDWGIIDEEGKWVVNPQFLRIVYIGEDDLLGVVDHEYSFGFIGLDGKYICNLNQYSALSDEIVCKAIGMGGIYIAHSDYVDVEAYVNAISNELTALNITTAGELKQEYDMKESAFPKWGGSTVVYKKKVMPGLTMEVTVPKLNAWNRVRKGWSYNYVFNPDEWVYKYTVKIQFDDYGKMRSQYTDIMHVLNDKFKYDREKDTYTIPGCDYATIKESPVNGLYTINMEFEIATD